MNIGIGLGNISGIFYPIEFLLFCGDVTAGDVDNVTYRNQQNKNWMKNNNHINLGLEFHLFIGKI
jgi:hypothetical protein